MSKPFDFYAAAVDDAVEAERERCLELYRWARRTMKLDAAEGAIRDGHTVEQLEECLRHDGH